MLPRGQERVAGLGTWDAAREARAEERRRAAPPPAALGEEPSAVASRAGRAGKDEA